MSDCHRHKIRWIILLSCIAILWWIYHYNNTTFTKCYDLLAHYDQAIDDIMFWDCETIDDPWSTALMTAHYKISGKQANELEKELINKFGMGELQRICCGREPKDGKQGEIVSPVLRKENDNFVLLIKMVSDYNEDEQLQRQKYERHQQKTNQDNNQKFSEEENFLIIVQLTSP